MFSQKFSSPQHKLADFFDVQIGNGETNEQFRQKLVSTVNSYRTQEDLKKKKEEIDMRNIEELEYIVVGHDEFLKEHKKKQGQPNFVLPLNTKRTAKKLFKNQTKFVKDIKPKTFVDKEGNIWGKI